MRICFGNNILVVTVLASADLSLVTFSTLEESAKEYFLLHFRDFVDKAGLKTLLILLQTCEIPRPLQDDRNLWIAINDRSLDTYERLHLLEIFLALFGRWTEIFDVLHEGENPEKVWLLRCLMLGTQSVHRAITP